MIVAAAFAVNQPVWQQTATYTVDADIAPRDAENLSIGVSVDTDKIDFGRIPVHAIGARKTIRLGNNEPRPARIRIRQQGNISDHLTIPARPVTIPPGSHHNVTIRFQTGEDTTPGRYTGSLIVEQQRPWWRSRWN